MAYEAAQENDDSPITAVLGGLKLLSMPAAGSDDSHVRWESSSNFKCRSSLSLHSDDTVVGITAAVRDCVAAEFADLRQELITEVKTNLASLSAHSRMDNGTLSKFQKSVGKKNRNAVNSVSSCKMVNRKDVGDTPARICARKIPSKPSFECHFVARENGAWFLSLPKRKKICTNSRRRQFLTSPWRHNVMLPSLSSLHRGGSGETSLAVMLRTEPDKLQSVKDSAFDSSTTMSQLSSRCNRSFRSNFDGFATSNHDHSPVEPVSAAAVLDSAGASVTREGLQGQQKSVAACHGLKRRKLHALFCNGSSFRNKSQAAPDNKHPPLPLRRQRSVRTLSLNSRSQWIKTISRKQLPYHSDFANRSKRRLISSAPEKSDSMNFNQNTCMGTTEK